MAADHSLSFPSSPPEATTRPSGEIAAASAPYAWPCCLTTYVSDCHSQTSSWPKLAAPRAIHSPVDEMVMAPTSARDTDSCWRGAHVGIS